MSYVGMATSVGQVMVIPIILRSLAESLACIRPADLPITFDSSFIALLDVGTTEEQFSRVVRSYALPWWSVTRRPLEDGILNGVTLKKCLAHHRHEQLFDMQGNRIPDIPNLLLPRLMLSAPANQMIYQSLAGDLLGHIRQTLNYASAMAASSLAHLDISSRRGCAFNTLHESVLLKELQSEPVKITGEGSGSKATRLSRAVAERAKAALEHVDPASFKWTWGETLTRAEVLGITDINQQTVHSGYKHSLRSGNFRGEDTAIESAPQGSSLYSTLPTDDGRPPSMHAVPLSGLARRFLSVASTTERANSESPATPTTTYPSLNAAAAAADWVEFQDDQSTPGRHCVVPSALIFGNPLDAISDWFTDNAIDEQTVDPHVGQDQTSMPSLNRHHQGSQDQVPPPGTIICTTPVPTTIEPTAAAQDWFEEDALEDDPVDTVVGRHQPPVSGLVNPTVAAQDWFEDDPLEDEVNTVVGRHQPLVPGFSPGNSEARLTIDPTAAARDWFEEDEIEGDTVDALFADPGDVLGSADASAAEMTVDM